MSWLRSPVLALSLSIASLWGCGAADNRQSSDPLAYFHSHRSERDTHLTPGDLCTQQNSHFDGLRYSERIPHCRREVPHEQKAEVAAAYGIHGDERHAYEIDHLIPLNIGGSNHSRNLWPLYRPFAREKSQYELWLMQQVASGRLNQARAIEQIRAWRPGTNPN